MKKEASIEKQKEIINKYINQNKSMGAIAKEYGVSPQRIQQIIHHDYGVPLTEEERKHKRKSITRKSTKTYYIKQRDIILDALGNVCCRCGFSDKRALQIDHINGGGNKEVNKKGQWKYRVDIIKMIEDGTIHTKYQLLCANCNWIKRHENKEFWW